MRDSIVSQVLTSFSQTVLKFSFFGLFLLSFAYESQAQSPYNLPEEGGVPFEANPEEIIDAPETLPSELNPPEPAIPEEEKVLQVVPFLKLKGYQFVVDSLTFSPDGTQLISGGGRNEPFLKVWSVETGKELQSVRAQQTAIKAIAVSPNSKVLATSGQDSDVHLWNLDALNDQLIFFEQELTVMAMAITPDSQVLVSGALDGIWLWTLRPRRPFYQLLGYGNPVYALSIAPNGYVVASGHEDGQVKFWNIREGNIEAEFRPHAKPISGVFITPDGQKLITASLDRTIKIWDLETGALLHELLGHNQIIRSIALSPDGKLLASSSNDGIRIWSVNTGRLVAKPYASDPEWVQSLAFSPDSRLLASGRWDGQIDLWQVRKSLTQATSTESNPE